MSCMTSALTEDSQVTSTTFLGRVFLAPHNFCSTEIELKDWRNGKMISTVKYLSDEHEDLRSMFKCVFEMLCGKMCVIPTLGQQ